MGDYTPILEAIGGILEAWGVPQAGGQGIIYIFEFFLAGFKAFGDVISIIIGWITGLFTG